MGRELPTDCGWRWVIAVAASAGLVAVVGQLLAEQVHEQAVMEAPVAAALVLPHHSDGPEANPGVAADRPVVRGRRVDGNAVVTALLEQESSEQRDGLAPAALALEAAA